MTDNSKQAAFPYSGYQQGLTKREYFAVTILNGLLAFSHEGNVPNYDNVVGSVHLSVKAADWLLEELEKEAKL